MAGSEQMQKMPNHKISKFNCNRARAHSWLACADRSSASAYSCMHMRARTFSKISKIFAIAECMHHRRAIYGEGCPVQAHNRPLDAVSGGRLSSPSLVIRTSLYFCSAFGSVSGRINS
jgi:hypothetical protein